MKCDTYYQEEEVGRLIVNYAQWAGDGVSVHSSASLFLRLLRELKRTAGGMVVTLGVDAGYTKTALERIGEELANAVSEYHLSPFPVWHQAKKLGIAKTTYYRRLERGHIEFMDAYRNARWPKAK